MLAATPRLRDRLDLRKIALVALIAVAALGLEAAFLAGVVASPLGGTIAALDRSPEVQGAPAHAVAAANAGARRGPDVTRVAQLRAGRPAAVPARHRVVRQDCPADAANPD